MIAIGALVTGYFVRARIFNRMETDRIAAPYLEDTSLFAFGDLLSLYLYRKRTLVAPEFKSLVETYFWLDITGFVALITMFALNWLAA